MTSIPHFFARNTRSRAHLLRSVSTAKWFQSEEPELDWKRCERVGRNIEFLKSFELAKRRQTLEKIV